MQAHHTDAEAARPKFRHDQLMAEALEDGGSKYVDVLDPDTGSMFRFYEVEFAIACGMDGQRDVGQLIAWAKDELGLLPTAVEVRNVIAQLGALGYLDLGAVAKEAAAAAPADAVATAKAAAKSADNELAPGIVVGTPQRDVQPPAPEVELGRAGPKHAANDRGAPVSDSIPVEDVALGAPGAQAAKAPKAPVEDVALGAPGRNTPVPVKTDVSLDLSDQVGVGLDDVKEAVRASKVMTAVEVPKDLAAILDEPPAAVEKPKPEPVKPVEAKAPVKPEPVVAKPEPKPEPVVAKPAEKPAEKQPIVAKQPPKQVEKPAEKQPVAPPAPSRVTTRLIILFVILLAVFGLYIVWTQVLKKSNSDGNKTGTTEPVMPPKPEVKPEPKPDPIKLSVTTPDVMTVKAEAAGTIEQVTTEKAVKKDQVIIWLKGGKLAQAAFDRPKQAYDAALKELDTARIALDAARATNNNVDAAEKKHADLEKKLAPKKEALDKAQAALDKVTIKAAADGEVTVTAKAGKVAEGDVLFSLAPSPVLVATFKETKPDVVVGSPVQLAVKGEETKLVCKATQVGDKSTAVECPNDAALDGKEVSLVGLAPPDAAKPEAPPETPATPEEPKPEQPKPEQPKPEQAQPKPPAPRPVPRPQPKPPEPKPEQPKPEEPKPDPATPPPADPAPAPTPP